MEIGLIGSIWTPFGEVELAPQDRYLLQAASVDPLQFSDLRIHLWALLELKHETWGVSDVAAPVLRLIGQPAHRPSIAGASVQSAVLNSVTALAGTWALAHPEAFECAAAGAFEFDKEGLHRELGALRESLTCSARAIESITSAARSAESARLHDYSQKMRAMASEVPQMQEIAQTISCPDEPLPTDLRVAWDARAVDIESDKLRDATGRDNSNIRVIPGPTVSRQSPSSNQTLGQVLRNRRKEIGLSQQELALKLGIKPAHIAQLESDRGPRPSFQLLSRAANALGLDKDRLFQLTETGAKSVSVAHKVLPNPKDSGQVFASFARNRALLDRYNVKPQELKALSQVSLMGKVTDGEALLFILEAIRMTTRSSFTDAIRAKAQPIWDRELKHPFVRGLLTTS
jgi:transcriptional regulator with XRE-family HTH domain